MRKLLCVIRAKSKRRATVVCLGKLDYAKLITEVDGGIDSSVDTIRIIV
jgi:hypothetical protein